MFEFEEYAINAFTKFAGLPPLLVDFPTLEGHDPAPLDWIALLHSDSPHFDSVVDFQEHMHNTGFKLQLALLQSDAPHAHEGIDRIQAMVEDVNKKVLDHRIFLEQDTAPAALGKLSSEMNELFMGEYLRAINKGPVLAS